MGWTHTQHLRITLYFATRSIIETEKGTETSNVIIIHIYLQEMTPWIVNNEWNSLEMLSIYTYPRHVRSYAFFLYNHLEKFAIPFPRFQTFQHKLERNFMDKLLDNLSQPEQDLTIRILRLKINGLFKIWNYTSEIFVGFSQELRREKHEVYASGVSLMWN